MAAISLDDIGSFAQAPAKKKSKAKVKAKTTVKKAKTVSKGVKVKKKKKSDSVNDELPKHIDPESFYSDIAASQKAMQSLNEPKPEKVKKKKKKENAVDTLKKKKKKDKKSLSTDVAVLEGQFIEAMDEIPDVIKQENAQIQEYMTMFTQCQDMARICEKQYKAGKQSRDIYALMQLYNQMREIIADLRALRDVGQLGEILNVEVLAPFAESAGTILVDVFHKLNAWNKKNLPIEMIAGAQNQVTQIVRNAAKDIEQSYQASLSKTVQIFSASA
ncbi:hypothetical protein pEaSNUABM40_00185 [Erwinia phage pEa_SNUABM_40]|uniref:Uncharacterized protein n=1 Tax=Erwinia phage pEa_SNUABM_3 TaxID=2869552 RepID=A0AAE8BYK7_9CAUD|nr:hypothetical protein MPK68_gp182 [Erwinia phage pEa_SNUABM_3]QZE56718.1 hypothetical protein pEaSNUABM20_00182 [Erwinia phage pEa_SNUABM_20]QZE58401.1 hypothetical protein pEaSNUABM40_00185 [Erwinia phage pEa_SNUABM_40]UAW52963.1 hypothetical protein pEaSNUABM23_00181 [Erwinia phage pEa_SNUABM_23]UIW10859.1 hypothetical protein pEaSNUABM23_00181 [Erwinia phage pEa_SNUABM_31]QZE56379.1 hypothetical protein pEaSNUABM3_00182 [Erwinia phage pEa_SNUABM_3]